MKTTTNKISRQRFNTDPAFERTRENITEFAVASKAMKIIKMAFRDMLIIAGDNKITTRLQKQTMRVLQNDLTSDRGRRLVSKGDLIILKGFNFNSSNGLAHVFFARYAVEVDRVAGKVTVSLPAFVPRVRIESSPEATHFQLVAVASVINFDNGQYDYVVQDTPSMTIDRNLTMPVTLELQLPANSPLPILVALCINFEQSVSNRMYQLNGGTHNAAAIVEVSMPAT